MLMTSRWGDNVLHNSHSAAVRNFSCFVDRWGWGERRWSPVHRSIWMTGRQTRLPLAQMELHACMHSPAISRALFQMGRSLEVGDPCHNEARIVQYNWISITRVEAQSICRAPAWEWVSLLGKKKPYIVQGFFSTKKTEIIAWLDFQAPLFYFPELLRWKISRITRGKITSVLPILKSLFCSRDWLEHKTDQRWLANFAVKTLHSCRYNVFHNEPFTKWSCSPTQWYKTRILTCTLIMRISFGQLWEVCKIRVLEYTVPSDSNAICGSPSKTSMIS